MGIGGVGSYLASRRHLTDGFSGSFRNGTAAVPSVYLVKRDANLYCVDERLCRSRQPVADGKAVIRAAGINHIINLRFFKRSGDWKVFDGRSGVHLINLFSSADRTHSGQVKAELAKLKQQAADGG